MPFADCRQIEQIDRLLHGLRIIAVVVEHAGDGAVRHQVRSHHILHAHLMGLTANRTGDLIDRSLYAEARAWPRHATIGARSEEHTSELQSLMRISYAVFCLK